MTRNVRRICIDCWAEWRLSNGSDEVDLPANKRRSAPHPGPRCATHHRMAVKRRQSAAADSKRALRYGMTGTAYRELVEAQGGLCAGCGVKPGPRAKRLAVDHDHAQARRDGHPHEQACRRCIRGALCYNCNSTLATYLDDEEKLIRLADYLKRWKALQAVRNFPIPVTEEVCQQMVLPPNIRSDLG